MDSPTAPTLSELLCDVDFPATGEDLLLVARRNGADPTLTELFRTFAFRSFSGRWEVNLAIEQSHALVA